MNSHPTDDATEQLARQLYETHYGEHADWPHEAEIHHARWERLARFVQEREARATVMAKRDAFVDGVMWYAGSIENPGSARAKAERLYPMPKASERVPFDPPRPIAVLAPKYVAPNVTQLSEESAKINELVAAVNELRRAPSEDR